MISVMPDKRVYLLFGEEQWVKNKYIQEIKKQFSPQGDDVMNSLTLEGKEISVSKVEDFCETMPFFVSHKTVFIKNSGLFKTGKKEETEKMSILLNQIPEYMVIVFLESEIDKRNKLYKWVNKEHQVISCDYLNEEETFSVLNRYCLKEEIAIEKKLLLYFIQNMPKSIENMFSELEKLKAYSEQDKITKEIIDQLCVFDVEQVVFQLLDEMVHKNTTKALSIYKKLIERKESPIGILVLIARQYRIILQIKYLIRNGSSNANVIGKQVGLPYFVVNKTMEQAKRLSFTLLQNILSWCLETDQNIKTGKQDPVSAVELLIVKCIYEKS